MVRELSHHTPLPRRTVLGERSDNVFASPLFPSAEAKSKKRDSFIMRVAQDADEMLLNVQPPSSVAGMTDTESEGEQTPVKSKGKAVIRAGRMATPEASQNITSSATPAKSRPSVRSRPSPTPPRSHLDASLPESSPNPRQKKHARYSKFASPSFDVVLAPKTTQGKKRASLESTSSDKGTSTKEQTSTHRKSQGPRKSTRASPTPSITRRRQTLTPAVLSRMVGHKVRIGQLPEPVSSQGEDPLNSAPDVGTVRGKGKGRAGTPGINTVVKSFPFKPYDPRTNKPYEMQGSALSLPKTVRRKGIRDTPMPSQDDDLGGYGDGFGSDSGGEGAYNDTFVDVVARRGEPSRRRFMLMEGEDLEEAEGSSRASNARSPGPVDIDEAASPVVNLRQSIRVYDYPLSDSELDDGDVQYPWTNAARADVASVVAPSITEDTVETGMADATDGEITDAAVAHSISATVEVESARIEQSPMERASLPPSNADADMTIEMEEESFESLGTAAPPSPTAAQRYTSPSPASVTPASLLDRFDGRDPDVTSEYEDSSAAPKTAAETDDDLSESIETGPIVEPVVTSPPPLTLATHEDLGDESGGRDLEETVDCDDLSVDTDMIVESNDSPELPETASLVIPVGTTHQQTLPMLAANTPIDPVDENDDPDVTVEETPVAFEAMSDAGAVDEEAAQHTSDASPLPIAINEPGDVTIDMDDSFDSLDHNEDGNGRAADETGIQHGAEEVAALAAGANEEDVLIKGDESSILATVNETAAPEDAGVASPEALETDSVVEETAGIIAGNSADLPFIEKGDVVEAESRHAASHEGEILGHVDDVPLTVYDTAEIDRLEEEAINTPAMVDASDSTDQGMSAAVSLKHTPIIQRLRRSLHAGSTPFGHRASLSRADPAPHSPISRAVCTEKDLYDASADEDVAEEEEFVNSPMRPSMPEVAVVSQPMRQRKTLPAVHASMSLRHTQESLFFPAAWQAPSDVEDEVLDGTAEEETAAEADNGMTSRDEEAIDEAWQSLLRKSGYDAWREVPVTGEGMRGTAESDTPKIPEAGVSEDVSSSPTLTPSKPDDLADNSAMDARGSDGPTGPPQIQHPFVAPMQSTTPLRYPNVASRAISPIMRPVASFEEMAMSAGGDLNEMDSHIGYVTADMTEEDAEWSDSASESGDPRQGELDNSVGLASAGVNGDIEQTTLADDAVDDQEMLRGQEAGAEGAKAVAAVPLAGEAGKVPPTDAVPPLPALQLADSEEQVQVEEADIEQAQEGAATSVTDQTINAAQADQLTPAVVDDSVLPIVHTSDIATTAASPRVPHDYNSTTPTCSPVTLPETLPVTNDTLPEAPPQEASATELSETARPGTGPTQSELVDGARPADAATDANAPPKRKIVLRLVTIGTIKIEPDVEQISATAHAPEVPSTPAAVKSTTVSTTPVATPSSVHFSFGPAAASVQGALLQDISAGTSTPGDPAPEQTQSSPTPASTVDAANASRLTEPIGTPDTSMSAAHAVPAPEPMRRTRSFVQANRPIQPSRLADVIQLTTDSSPAGPDADPDETIEMEEDASEDEEEAHLSPRHEADVSFASTSADLLGASTASRRSMLDEIIRAEGPAAKERLKGVVEISSLDPKAAARAAAILKMNHDYIEHGIMSDSNIADSSASRMSGLGANVDKEELLYQAELEIAEKTPGTPTTPAYRIMRESTAFSTASTNLPLPGAWISTPVIKRKRQEAANEPATYIANGDGWGIADWKRLEKVFKREKEAWVKERQVKALPSGGFLSWARKSFARTQKAPDVKEWDARRVIEAFAEAEKGAGREWDMNVLQIRVQALEKRVDEKLARNTQLDETSPAKRAKSASGSAVPSTPARSSTRSAGPLGSINRVMNWVWGSAAADPLRPASGPSDDASPAMRSNEAARPATIATPAIPASRPQQDPTLGSSILGLSTSSSATSLTMPLNTPAVPSRLYPSLQPPITQRSSAIKALFSAGHPLAESSYSAPGPRTRQKEPIRRSASVKDMVQAFEENGTLGDLLNSRRG